MYRTKKELKESLDKYVALFRAATQQLAETEDLVNKNHHLEQEVNIKKRFIRELEEKESALRRTLKLYL